MAEKYMIRLSNNERSRHLLDKKEVNLTLSSLRERESTPKIGPMTSCLRVWNDVISTLLYNSSNLYPVPADHVFFKMCLKSEEKCPDFRLLL